MELGASTEGSKVAASATAAFQSEETDENVIDVKKAFLYMPKVDEYDGEGEILMLLWSLFLEQKFTDISIKIFEEPNSRPRFIRCHRVILARIPWLSKVFAKMGERNNTVQVDNISAKMLLHILGYAYTNLCTFFSYESVLILDEIDDNRERLKLHIDLLYEAHLDIAHNPGTPSSVLNEVRLHWAMLAEAAFELEFQQMIDRMNNMDTIHGCEYLYQYDTIAKYGDLGPLHPNQCALVLQNYSAEDFKYCIEKAYTLERSGYFYLPVSQVAKIIALESDGNPLYAKKSGFYDEAIKSCPEFAEDLVQSLKHELCVKALKVKELQEKTG